MGLGEVRPAIWREPVRGGFAGPGYFAMPGIERVRAQMRGDAVAPPIVHLLGLRLTQLASGTVSFSLKATPWLQLPEGTLDITMLAGIALDAAATTSAPPGVQMKARALSLNHMRPSTLDNEALLARARVVHTGRLFTFTEVLLEDALGRVAGHATGSYVAVEVGPLAAAPGDAGEPLAYDTPDPYMRPLPAPPFPFGIFDELGGLDVARLMVAGDLPAPPNFLLTGLRILDADEGSMVGTMPATEWLCGPDRSIWPAALAYFASVTAGGTVLTLGDAGQRAGLLGEALTLSRPVEPGGELVVRARVVDRGEVITVRSEMVDGAGATVALASHAGVLVDRAGRGARDRPATRVLRTVLFTDVVGSTERVRELGDAAWRELLERHHHAVRRHLRVFGGAEVKTTGDGFLAIFESAARAVQCARAVRDDLDALGLPIRAGLHVGECELHGGDVSGIAVHVAQRVLAVAGPGEIVVSGTVRDVADGSGVQFADRGVHALKGLEGEWRLYAVSA